MKTFKKYPIGQKLNLLERTFGVYGFLLEKLALHPGLLRQVSRLGNEKINAMELSAKMRLTDSIARSATCNYFEVKNLIDKHF